MAITVDQPAYLRVYRVVADEIAAGRLRAGDRLPPERWLCDRLGVSRAAVRRGIAELSGQGLVERPARRRAFVAGELLSEPPNALLSFTELGRRRGLEPTSRLLSREPRSATLLEADGFGITPGEALLSLRRLRFLDGEAVAVDETLVPLGLAPGLLDIDFATTSLYSALAAHGIDLVRADYDVAAVPIAAPEAELLGVAPGTPGLLANTRTRSHDGRVVEVASTVYRGDRYRFQATLMRPVATQRGRTP